jgi:hypothetical protein
MTKKQIDNHAKTLGVELDGRKSKKDMITELNKASKPTVKKKAVKKPSKAVKKPSKAVKKPSKAVKKPTPKLSFWGKVKKYLNL